MSLYLGNNLVSGVATPIEGARNIGQIIQSTVPLSDAGLHLLDGALINGAGSYGAFVTYIGGLVSSYPNLFVTEANWQQSVTTYGVCGKFVYNSVNNTVRLPKITGFTEGTIDPTVLGNLVQAGLPNITGKINNVEYQCTSTPPSSTGALFNTTKQGKGEGNGNYYYGDLQINASRSSSIYGKSNTVQPQAIKVLYYIVIATSTKTDIEVDIDEVMTDLNGKADVDLSNCTKPHIVETYVNGKSWYRVWSADSTGKRWCEQGGYKAAESSSGVPFTISLLKSFSDTNYNVVLGTHRTAQLSDGYAYFLGSVVIKTVNTFGLWLDSNKYVTGCYWQACGYIS